MIIMCKLMYLNSVPVFIIILVGRWSSEALLLYIRKKVLSFTSGISQCMILGEEFHTVPDEQRNSSDLALYHNTQSFTTNMTPTTSKYTCVTAPSISLFH